MQCTIIANRHRRNDAWMIGPVRFNLSRKVRLDLRALPFLHLSSRGLPRPQVLREVRQSRVHDQTASRDPPRSRRFAEPLRCVPPPAGPRNALTPRAAAVRQRACTRAVSRAARERRMGIIYRSRVTRVSSIGAQDAQGQRVRRHVELWGEGRCRGPSFRI